MLLLSFLYFLRKNHQIISTKKKTKIHSGSRLSKRPKPVFNDGRKLDNSVDWETIKIAKPPPEDLSDSNAAKVTTITNKELTTPASEADELKHMKSKTIKKLEIIRKELDGLQQDIEKTEAIKGNYQISGKEKILNKSYISVLNQISYDH